jgi:hypothetical protein
MLRIVHPPRGGNGGDPPARRRSRSTGLSLTSDEARHFRAAAKNTARAYGGLRCLADAMRVAFTSLRHATYGSRRRPSAGLALALARAAGVSVESILSGALTAAGRCPTCGHRAGDGRLVAGGAR